MPRRPLTYKLTITISLVFSLTLAGCSFFGGRSSTEPVESDSVQEATERAPDSQDRPAESTGPSVGVGGTSTAPAEVTLSFTNSLESPFFIKPSQAKKRLAFLRKQKSANATTDSAWQIDQMTLMRLMGASYGQLYSRGKKAMDRKLSANINAKTPERLLLELAHSAFREGKVVLSEFYLRQIMASKDKRWVSNAQTLQGLIYLKENKLPEAALEWQAALRKNPANKGAATNLGLMALKYGDLKTAKLRLARAGGHWQALLGLAIVARQQKQFAKARSLCNQALSQNRRSKTALLSCALVEADGFKDKAKAESYLDEALKLTTGSDRVNEKILATKRKLARLGGGK